jgi:LuxR family transcriptional regulator, maltose regulon positive regulatory protein
VLGWAEDRLGSTGDLLFLRACGPAAISRFGAASDHLRPLLDGTVAPLVPWTLIEARLLECAIALRTGRTAVARAALREALAASESMGVLRPLVAAPADVGEFLAEQLDGLRGMAPLARQVLDIRGFRDRGVPLARLTERERAVLDLLPTLLSLEEIAETLTVSVNTVKTHVRAIYDKFGVTSRRDAVAAARGEGV